MASVLVVDDDASIVQVIAEVVKEHGHSALTAFDGATALQLARAHRPELIISDVMMPVMDGYALLQALRADPELARAAVYLMSATPLQPSVGIAPDGYIRKPFDLSAIDGLLAGIAPKGNEAGS